MNLFSILIADNMVGKSLEAGLPPAVARNIESFKSCHPGLPHKLYDKDSIREFLSARMGREVLWAFDQLLAYAYKADLARLCLLHEYGGVYADLSVFFHGSWDVKPGKISIFRDRAHVAPWIVSNTIISAPPRFPAIEAAIRMILANCHARRRGSSPLCPTGPVLLGKAIATHCEPEQVHMGEVTNAAFRDTVESLVFVDSNDGRLIGYRSKTKAGLTELGLQNGVNNYNDFYHSGVIYANDFPVTIPAEYLHRKGHARFPLVDGMLECRRTVDGSDRSELVLFGNFLPFCPGRYAMLLDLSAAEPGSVLTLVVTQTENKEELSRTDYMLQGGPATLAIHVDLASSRNDIAIGVLVAHCSSMKIAQLRILRADSQADDSLRTQMLSAAVQRRDESGPDHASQEGIA